MQLMSLQHIVKIGLIGQCGAGKEIFVECWNSSIGSDKASSFRAYDITWLLVACKIIIHCPTIRVLTLCRDDEYCFDMLLSHLPYIATR